MAQVSKYIVDVVRTRSNEFGTFGRLFVNDFHVCYTLEPAKNSSMLIPLGDYDLALNIPSPKFRFRYPYNNRGGCVPRLLNVPGHDGILIHIGNFLCDTKGCILVGKVASLTRLFYSTSAYKDFLDSLGNSKHCLIRIKCL